MTPRLIAAGSGVLAAGCIFEVSRILVSSRFAGQARGRLAVLTGAKPAGEAESTVTALGAAVACACAALVTLGFGQALAVMAVVPVASVANRRVRAKRQLRQVEASLPGQLRALADGLLVGRTLEQAAADCGRSGTAAGQVLGRFALARLAGAELGAALQLLTDGGGAAAWSPVAVAVSLNRRCGGDLPAALCGIADSLQAQADTRGDADAATAQARFTARLVLGLPLVGLAGLCLVTPEIPLRVASTPASIAMASLAVGLQLICMVVIRRIAAHACA